jgi:hypothetical protein
VTRALVLALGTGWVFAFGTLRADRRQTLEEVKQVRSRFLAGLRRWCQARSIRYQLLCACEVGINGRPHDHYLLASTRPIPKSVLRSIYAEAVGHEHVTVVDQPPKRCNGSDFIYLQLYEIWDPQDARPPAARDERADHLGEQVRAEVWRPAQGDVAGDGAGVEGTGLGRAGPDAAAGPCPEATGAMYPGASPARGASVTEPPRATPT